MPLEQFHQPTPQFSYLGVPAPAGMSDWYESMSRTPIRDALEPLSSAPLNPNNPRSRHSREGGNPRTNISRTNANRDNNTYVHTATPLRLSGNCAPRTQIRDRNPEEMYGWQMTRKQLHSSTPRCSYLGVPAPAAMSDWYESMSRTPIRDRPLRQLLIRDSPHPYANPAPHSSFWRRPEYRRGGQRRLWRSGLSPAQDAPLVRTRCAARRTTNLHL